MRYLNSIEFDNDGIRVQPTMVGLKIAVKITEMVRFKINSTYVDNEIHVWFLFFQYQLNHGQQTTRAYGYLREKTSPFQNMGSQYKPLFDRARAGNIDRERGLASAASNQRPHAYSYGGSRDRGLAGCHRTTSSATDFHGKISPMPLREIKQTGRKWSHEV